MFNKSKRITTETKVDSDISIQELIGISVILISAVTLGASIVAAILMLPSAQ